MNKLSLKCIIKNLKILYNLLQKLVDEMFYHKIHLSIDSLYNDRDYLPFINK